MSVTGSTSEAEKQKRKGRRMLGCFFTVFLLMGLAFTVVFLWPIVEILQARNWRETSCTILSSEVQTHRGSKGSPTYSVAVSYEYFVEDDRYVSTRYKFMGGSSSGYDGKAEIVQRLAHRYRRVLSARRDFQNGFEFVLRRLIGGRAFEDDFDRGDGAAFVIADLRLSGKSQQAKGRRQQTEKQKALNAFHLTTFAFCFLRSAGCLLLHFRISSGT